MAKKKAEDFEHKIDMNLTPMIDVVFLLLIFFMIVSELSALDAEQMTLPWAHMAKPPDPAALAAQKHGLVVINVLKPTDPNEAGIIRIRGKKLDKEKLREHLRAAANSVPWENTKKRISTLRVLIRADMECRYEAVQIVFDACQVNGIYKTEIAGSGKYVSPPRPAESS
ncbi:MAG: biopolymer transporter ExbD [Planctomycetota bacterium]|nr:MAG: biopolymer transporter ExbD [Planctomycetota bacterium]